MSDRFVPITLGSPEHVTLAIDGFRVNDVRFRPGDVLPPHEHEWPGIAVMLDGGFDLSIRGRKYSCTASTAFTEPGGERHSNRILEPGAHVLVVQVDPSIGPHLRRYTEIADAVHYVPHASITAHARSMAHELCAPDGLTPLAVEGLVLEFLSGLGRYLERGEKRPPRWLVRVEELLHERFREVLHSEEIASEVNVHPVHLMRVFRERHRTSIGEYVRQLRIEWAALRLSSTDEPLAQIAQQAGFADQSHFTRLFRARTGRTPARYRAAARRRRASHAS
jgi:AraC family transcriptional regulator